MPPAHLPPAGTFSMLFRTFPSTIMPIFKTTRFFFFYFCYFDWTIGAKRFHNRFVLVLEKRLESFPFWTVDLYTVWRWIIRSCSYRFRVVPRCACCPYDSFCRLLTFLKNLWLGKFFFFVWFFCFSHHSGVYLDHFNEFVQWYNRPRIHSCCTAVCCQEVKVMISFYAILKFL